MTVSYTFTTVGAPTGGLRWYYSVDDSTVLEITDRVRWPTIDVGAHADAGSGWEGDLYVDDPNGDLIPLMFRKIYCNDDDAPAGAQVIGYWFISNLKVKRTLTAVGVQRTWVITMADENCLLGRAIFIGTDSNRPEETDIERLRWFLTTTEGSFFTDDETYIDTTNPVTLDAFDLRQSTPEDMFMAMMQASGKHYWVMYREDLTPHAYGIWYADQNTSTLYPSTLSLSNVASQVGVPETTLVYALSGDAELDRAGGRMAYQLVAPYRTGWVVAANADFLSTYGHVDRSAPAPEVTSLAKATAQVQRQLAELQLPDDEISTTWTVETPNLNLIRHGMRIPVHATHFPNYTDDSNPSLAGYQLPGYAADYVWCRVVERTIRQVGPTTFEVPLRLSPQTIAVTTPVFCCLTWPKNGATHSYSTVEWDNSGDNPKGGDPTYPNGTPTSGLVTKIAGTVLNDWKGFLIGGTGPVNITCTSSFITVLGTGTHTANFDLRLNGTMIARTQYIRTFGGLTTFTSVQTVSKTGLAVVPGDIIDHIITVDGSTGPGLFTVPAGTGEFSQRMVLTGDLA